jgi:hypothetical protein
VTSGRGGTLRLRSAASTTCRAVGKLPKNIFYCGFRCRFRPVNFRAQFLDRLPAQFQFAVANPARSQVGEVLLRQLPIREIIDLRGRADPLGHHEPDANAAADACCIGAAYRQNR